MSILDTIERVVFGASAAEAVELRIKLAEQRILAALAALALEGDDEECERESAGESEGEAVDEHHA